MESLERLASSIAQAELLVASLKRENRDLAGRLAQAAMERLADTAAAEAALRGIREAEGRADGLAAQLSAALAAPRHDPGLEARVFDAEHRAGTLAKDLAEAEEAHRKERARLEALIRRLEAQVLASHGQEQLPIASAETLADAAERERGALAALAASQQRGLILEAELRDLQSRMDALLAGEDRAQRLSEGLKSELAERERRAAELAHSLTESEKLLEHARKELERAASARQDQAELRRQKREAAAFARERQNLRRKLEELLATLESARL